MNTKKRKSSSARCNHTWCKQRQQKIGFGGPKHSCDGTLELDHLMKQQGWKYCPCTPVLACCHYHQPCSPSFLACKTPIQKVSGCNHMTVHFYCDLAFIRQLVEPPPHTLSSLQTMGAAL